MIAEASLDIMVQALLWVMDGFNVIELPLELIETLYTITCYGVWVVGGDVLGIIGASIAFWMVFKFAVGLVIWIYELIPFI